MSEGGMRGARMGRDEAHGERFANGEIENPRDRNDDVM